MMLVAGPRSAARVFGRGFGDASASVADLATLTALRNSFPVNSADWTVVNNLIQNPAMLATDIGKNQLAGAVQTAAQLAAAAANPTYTYTDASGNRQVGMSVPAGATNVVSSASMLTSNPNPAVVQAAAKLAPTLIPDNSPISSPVWTGSPIVSNPDAVTALSFTLTNQSRGGQDFQVGDNWSLSITGPPGQPVYIAANHNGTSVPKTQYGLTDSNGVFTLQGSMGADSIGSWSETYYVGNQAVGSRSFQVLQSPGPSGTQSTAPVDLTNTAGTMAMTTVDPAPVPADFGVTNPIPWWGWLGLAALGYVVLKGVEAR